MKGLRVVALVLMGAWGSVNAAEKKVESPWDGLEYRVVGPAIGGRVSRVAGVASDPNVYYAALAQGGVWKSVNGGLHWEPIFDAQITQSIGSIAVAASEPSVIYVGSGEANIRGNVSIGHGIFVSRDAGASWQHVFKTKGQIGTMAVHPRNSDIAFAAVLGSPFGPNADRGVYRTTDGGKTWQQVLKVNAETGASDVAIDVNRPNVIFAGMWQARRQPWQLTTAGKGSGLYRSNDGGDTWNKIEHEGLPKGEWGRVGVAVAPSDSQRIYALIEAKEGGLFRSDDGGETWKRQNTHRVLQQRNWYYSTLTVDPSNADIVWFPQVPMLRTLDGGKSIHQVSGFRHGDHHDVWINPRDSKRLIVGNDGGMEVSVDGGKTWSAPDLPIAQLYNIDVDDRVPYHVGGTIQDQGTFSGPAHPRVSGGNTLANWENVGGGEAGDFVYDRTQVGGIYAGEYLGIITHYLEGTGDVRNVSVHPYNGSGHGAKDLRYRMQWTAPIDDSPHDAKTIYHGAQMLLRSRDQGTHWEAISPDLTRNDKSKQQWSGGPITGDNTGVEFYGTVFSIAESPLTPGELWVGTDDGLIQLSRDAGKTWNNVSTRAWPEWATVESIEPSRHVKGLAYAAIDAHRLNDFTPQVYVTRDHGRSWKHITKGLPTDCTSYVVREDERVADLLYFGGECGVYVSHDGGALWHSLRLNLPAVAVVDIEARHDDLILATRGRSVWALEDVNALRQLQNPASHALTLLPPKPVHRIRRNDRWDADEEADTAAKGALLTYWLPSESSEALSLEIRDAQGVLVRTLSSVPKPARWPEDDPDEPTEKPEPELNTKKGLHRVVWDLRGEGARIPDRIKIDWGDPADGIPALPGVYRATLKQGKIESRVSLEIKIDPKVEINAAELKLAHDFQQSIRTALQHTADAIDWVRAVNAQTNDLITRLGDTAPEVSAKAKAVLAQSAALEAKLHNPKAEVAYDILAFEGGARLYSQLSPLYAFALDSDRAPPQGQQQRLAELQTELNGLRQGIEALKQNEIAVLEAVLKSANIGRLILPVIR